MNSLIKIAGLSLCCAFLMMGGGCKKSGPTSFWIEKNPLPSQQGETSIHSAMIFIEGVPDSNFSKCRVVYRELRDGEEKLVVVGERQKKLKSKSVKYRMNWIDATTVTIRFQNDKSEDLDSITFSLP